MKNNLDKLEAKLQLVIENWAQLLPTGGLKTQLARQLVESMKSSIFTDENGRLSGHHIYIIHISKNQFNASNFDQEILDALSKTLLETAQEEGIVFMGKPMVITKVYEVLNDDRGFYITSESRITKNENTAAMSGEKSFVEKTNNQTLPKAFILVNDNEIYNFDQSVINIGRRKDNQIVIDDLHISREHAQIRAVQGKYVIFDLGTTGGTYINGHRITQQILNPGDVISLAGVPLIYGEDTDPMELLDQINEDKTKKLSIDDPPEKGSGSH